MENRGLERLVLSGCLLGDEGLRSLAPGLRSCCINDLSLASCRLTDAGGALLCSIIKAQSARRNDERCKCVSLRSSLSFPFLRGKPRTLILILPLTPTPSASHLIISLFLSLSPSPILVLTPTFHS